MSLLPKATKTVIGGFKIEMDDCDGSIQCWVEKGNCCSSLALLEGEGYIESTGGNESITVPIDVIDKIRVWAESHGY